METTFEQSALIKYCLSNPLKVTFVTVLLVVGIISADQLFNGVVVTGIQESVFKVNTFTITYVGWCSTNPELISYFQDSYDPSVTATEVGDLVSLKSKIQVILHQLEIQIKVFRKLISFVF